MFTDEEIIRIWDSLFDPVEETEYIILELIPMCGCFWCRTSVDDKNS